jgi:hypothetical protein
MTTSTKRRIYLNEFNLLMNGATYLPLVSGLLRANAEQSEVVREHFATGSSTSTTNPRWRPSRR